MADDLAALRGAVAELAGELGGFNKTVRGAVDYGRRNRWLARIAIAGFVLDIILSVVIGFLGVTAVDTADRAQRFACSESFLWQGIIAQAKPPPDETPEARKAREALSQKFLSGIVAATAGIDCKKVLEVEAP